MKKNWTLLLIFMLTFGCTIAQEQQLKTFHHFEGEKEDRVGLTYTGYEDELGKIIRHGHFSYVKGSCSTTENYKNGKLEGDAVYRDTKPGIVCYIKFQNGEWTNINYTQEHYQYYLYNDAMYGKIINTGPIILKCSRTKQGLPIGDFELTFIAPYENISIRGKFDNSSKATGYWAGLRTDMNGTVYYENGYCLGDNEDGINYGRKYLIENNLAEQELFNKGFYFDPTPFYANGNYSICNTVREGDGTTINRMLSDNLYSISLHIRHHTGVVLGNNLINFEHSFIEGALRGEPIVFMSAELYQKLKVDPLQFKYNSDLKKYFVLKTDRKTRLYVPLELEEEFNQILKQKKEQERQIEKAKEEAILRKKKEECSELAIKSFKENLSRLIKSNDYYYQPNAKKFSPIVDYSIDSTSVSDSFDECNIFVTLCTGVSNSQRYLSYKTNVLMKKEYDSYKLNYEFSIDKDRSFVKKERVNNTWDYIENLKDTSKLLDKQLLSYKEYPTVISSYKNENVSYKNVNRKLKEEYEYFSKTVSIQKAYLKFIDLVKLINKRSSEIMLAAKEENDVAKSYQSISKNWNLSVNNNIFAEIKRLEDAGYYDVQDSCLTFIELRKIISKNNAQIADYSKAASNIVKAYNAFEKNIDLTWNQEAGRNQELREIIKEQDEFINILSKNNIGEIDKAVKKSKAKTWNEVKKIILQ